MLSFDDYIEAYMKGALDAWNLARRDPEFLQADFMTAKFAEPLVKEMKENNREESHEHNKRDPKHD